MKRIALMGTLCLMFTSCSTAPQRVFLDSTSHKDSPPSWAESTKIMWEDGDKIMYKASHTIKGNERVNGCYDLAKLDVSEALLKEMANDIKGAIDNAQQSISENAEVILGKVRTSEYKGKVSGLKFSEDYYTRYANVGTERIDCFTLASITKVDYDKVKQGLLNDIVAVDPKLKEAITNKQIEFFKK